METTAYPRHRRELLGRARARSALPLLRQPPAAASYVGIAPMPYQSGGSTRPSISRAGNPSTHDLIQLAWLWLRYQPGSALSAWFRDRVGTLQGRTRRIAIGDGKKTLDCTLALRRDWRHAGGLEIRTAEEAAASNRIVAGASPTATIREARPSSSLVTLGYRVSGGSRLTGQASCRRLYGAGACQPDRM